jgi:VanZ family protein
LNRACLSLIYANLCAQTIATRESREISPSVPACGQGQFSSMYPLLRLTCAWMLVFHYAVSMSIISSLSHPPVASSWDLLHLDKRYHFLTYRGLTFVLTRSLCLSGVSGHSISLGLWAALLAIASGSWRISQSFTPDCMMSVNDLLADWMEVSMVASVWSSVQRGKPALVESRDQPRRSRSYATGGILLFMRL